MEGMQDEKAIGMVKVLGAALVGACI